MMILKTHYRMCPCCMQEHEIHTVQIKDENIFKGEKVEFDAIYEYCDQADELYSTEEMMSENDISMKNAYRKMKGMLTSDEIVSVRDKYGISQSDLAIVLGWGEKTITRYEGHQVQDTAHDEILRKLSMDPQWFIELLIKNKAAISNAVYEKYYGRALGLYETERDRYLRSSIMAQYLRLEADPDACGGVKLQLDKVVDVIRYFSNSAKIRFLYKVKLMKLLWYSDALSFKTSGKSITGLVYKAFAMGALPIANDLIIDLKEIHYEEIDFAEGTGYRFLADNDQVYKTLSKDDISVLERIIDLFGNYTKTEIVDRMHNERAYIETRNGDIIRFSLAKDLSITI